MSDRLFFAFWPDDALRTVLDRRFGEWLGDYPCRPQRPDQWHLTLEFLGEVGRKRQDRLHDAAASLQGSLDEELVVVLDRLEHWARPEVLCLVSSDVPAAVTRLSEALREALRRRGFAPERRAFRPHLTLARKARRVVPAREVEPVRWPVRSLHLVKSISDATGSRYEPAARWNLLQEPAPGSSPAAGAGGRESGDST